MNCVQRVTIDYIPGTVSTIGITADGITDTLDLSSAILNGQSTTHFRLVGRHLEFLNERYDQTGDTAYVEKVGAGEVLGAALLEDVSNVDGSQPKAGDILYYVADNDCGPNCVGVNDKWVKLNAPTDDGTYRLTMTVSNGIPTITWERQ